MHTSLTLSLSLALVLVLVLSPAPRVEAQWWHRTINVRIINKLESKATIDVHCKDKKHDIGMQHVAFDKFYEFGFEPSFWGNTLYFCGVVWDGKVHWFDSYKHNRDFKDCRGDCVWHVKGNGPCLQNPNGDDGEKCYGWGPDA